MSKETALEQYNKFEIEDSKRFASSAPLVLSLLATQAATTGLYAFGGTETLLHVFTNPEGIIPIVIVNGATAISFIRSVRKRINLESITKGIAQEEERALLPNPRYEIYRTRRILHLSRLISPLSFESPDFKTRMVMAVDFAHSTAKVLSRKKPLGKLPGKGSDKTIGDVMQQDHDAEVTQIVKTATDIAIPRWAEYSEDYNAAGIEINEALTILNQNSALK